MRNTLIKKIEKSINKDFPWGVIFAKRENFEWGYFVQGGGYVKKYLRKKSDILVLGAGNGREARPICRDGHRIVCIDTGLGYLLSGRMLFAAEKVDNVFFVLADALNLPFISNSFDFIFCSLYSVVSDLRFDLLRGVGRLLRPGGKVMLSNSTSLYLKIHNAPKDLVAIDDIKQLRREVNSCGFEVLESAVDPVRSEYRCSVLKKTTGN